MRQKKESAEEAESAENPVKTTRTEGRTDAVLPPGHLQGPKFRPLASIFSASSGHQPGEDTPPPTNRVLLLTLVLLSVSASLR
jgi:hypothetical protein